MDKLVRLSEAADTTRFGVVLANLDKTIETAHELMGGGVVPTAEQLLAIWHAHEKLGVLFAHAEKARAKK